LAPPSEFPSPLVDLSNAIPSHPRAHIPFRLPVSPPPEGRTPPVPAAGFVPESHAVDRSRWPPVSFAVVPPPSPPPSETFELLGHCRTPLQGSFGLPPTVTHTLHISRSSHGAPFKFHPTRGKNARPPASIPPKQNSSKLNPGRVAAGTLAGPFPAHDPLSRWPRPPADSRVGACHLLLPPPSFCRPLASRSV